MDKEEALKKVRQMSLPKETMEILEALAPELAESEDERIRKALVWHLKADVDFVSNGVTKAECLAYLEKQKEQKPVDYEAELKKCKDNPLYFYDKYVSIKLKPAKWSEEDEEMLQSIIKDFRAGKVSTIGQEQWLKSLHPSWKPSEEQMEALLNAEGFLRAGLQHDSAKTIADLYEQLKKL